MPNYEFNTDCWMKVGKLHPVCDDYTLVQSTPENICAIVADGCSSVPFTGEGSRILARSALKHINDFGTPTYGEQVLATALAACQLIQLPEMSLCCTLIVAKVVNNKVKITMYGDGAVIGKLRNQEKWKVCTNHFRKRVSGEPQPYYLFYENDIRHRSDWQDTTDVIAEDFFISNEGEKLDTIETPIQWEPGLYNFTFDLEKYEWVGLVSDGIFSFDKKVQSSTSTNRESVDVGKIIHSLVSFKRLRGEFVQQRCKRACKTLGDEGCENIDDFSMAVISAVEKESENESGSPEN